MMMKMVMMMMTMMVMMRLLMPIMKRKSGTFPGPLLGHAPL